MKLEHACSISIRFFKITDPCDGSSFLMCSHDPFFGTNKIGSLKTDRVNGPLHCRASLSIQKWHVYYHGRQGRKLQQKIFSF